MWPFSRKKKEEKSHVARNVVAGLIIGGAISSIVGKKLLDKHGATDEDAEDTKDENGFTVKEV